MICILLGLWETIVGSVLVAVVAAVDIYMLYVFGGSEGATGSRRIVAGGVFMVRELERRFVEFTRGINNDDRR